MSGKLAFEEKPMATAARGTALARVHKRGR
jgi:hypothetical protein